MSKSNPEHGAAVLVSRHPAPSIEAGLRTADNCDAWVIANDHANLDSLPLRYGVHFDNDTLLRLSGVRFLYRDEQYPDRFHIEACIEIEGQDSHPGHFVLGSRSGRGKPDIVTVWRGDVKTEFGLSELMVSLRKRGYVKPADLLELHPLYLNGKVSTAADLVHHLAAKLATGQFKDMEAEVAKANATAAKAIDTLEKARRKAQHAESVALEATYLVSKLEAENAEQDAEIEELRAALAIQSPAAPQQQASQVASSTSMRAQKVTRIWPSDTPNSPYQNIGLEATILSVERGSILDRSTLEFELHPLGPCIRLTYIDTKEQPKSVVDFGYRGFVEQVYQYLSNRKGQRAVFIATWKKDNVLRLASDTMMLRKYAGLWKV